MSSEQQQQTEEAEVAVSETATKPKRQRKPKDPNAPPKAKFEPIEVGVDEKGNKLFLGPMKGRYYGRETKNGNIRKVYQVLEEGDKVGSEGEVKRRAPRKRKATTAAPGEPEAKEQKLEGSLVSAATPEEACLMNLLV